LRHLRLEPYPDCVAWRQTRSFRAKFLSNVSRKHHKLIKARNKKFIEFCALLRLPVASLSSTTTRIVDFHCEIQLKHKNLHDENFSPPSVLSSSWQKLDFRIKTLSIYECFTVCESLSRSVYVLLNSSNLPRCFPPASQSEAINFALTSCTDARRVSSGIVEKRSSQSDCGILPVAVGVLLAKSKLERVKTLVITPSKRKIKRLWLGK
jgi:hypothetical protein